jgi:UDP-3-O-[3-hydroxymyristoyl] glucosamine N-acyltransferase
LVGDGTRKVTGINEIHMVEPGDVVFVDHAKYYDATLQSTASVVLIDKEVSVPTNKTLLVVADPFTSFKKLCVHFLQEKEETLQKAPKIAKTAIIHEGVSIGKYVTIGERTVIFPGVVIYDHTVIGNDVIIHANSVIGADAFYFKRRKTHHDKMLCIGNVVIEDEVEIGAACTIDRGVSASTRIGKGSKLDNQIQIGHDTVIGERCLFAAHVGIAGCVKIEDEVVMWGQVGCAANVTIGKGAVILAQSGISKSLPGATTYFGSPAGPSREKMKELATLSLISRAK